MESTRHKNAHVWLKISKEIEQAGYKAKDLANKASQKWRNLLKAHKKAVDNKKKTGRGRKDFEYFKEMEDVVGRRHDIIPPNNGWIRLPQIANHSTAVITKAVNMQHSRALTAKYTHRPNCKRRRRHIVQPDPQCQEEKTSPASNRSAK